jgi:Putative addiction module component
MILERFPDVRRLPNSEKTQLVVELLEDLRESESESEISDPVLLEILHHRRASFEANPNTARRWEEVRDDLLQRASH